MGIYIACYRWINCSALDVLVLSMRKGEKVSAVSEKKIRDKALSLSEYGRFLWMMQHKSDPKVVILNLGVCSCPLSISRAKMSSRYWHTEIRQAL